MVCYSELFSGMSRGRWSNERTMKLHIQDSLSLLNDLRFRMTPKRATFVANWRTLSCVEPTLTGTGRGRGRKTSYSSCFSPPNKLF